MINTNYDQICAELEKQELTAPSGIPPAHVYSQLLAIYLYQNDMCNAKYLWKRIPVSVQSTCPELYSLWAIGQKLWKKDWSATYRALSAHAWTEPVVDIVKALEEKVRERAFALISKSYSSISIDTVMGMTGLDKEAATQATLERGWQLTDEGVTVVPSPPAQTQPMHVSSEDQLYKLTEFVSFLEN